MQLSKGDNEKLAQSDANANSWGIRQTAGRAGPGVCLLMTGLGHFLSHCFLLARALKTLQNTHFEVSICGPSQGDAERSWRGLSPQASASDGTKAGGLTSMDCLQGFRKYFMLLMVKVA